ncbi:MAG: hypothetical protein K1X88_36015, partial [Nannocystaceae bacterium]|nr:hypothetical protein [Nannocystaceae bacterium]
RLAYADAPQLLVPYLLEAGQLLALQDAPAAAEALYAEAAPLVEEQPRAAVLLDVARAAAALRLGEPGRAWSLAHDARVQLEADAEVAPSNLAAARHNEADAAIALGRCDDAVPLLRAAIARYDADAGIGPGAPSTTDARLSLARCDRAAGRIDAARATLEAVRDQPTANADHRARAVAELAALP